MTFLRRLRAFWRFFRECHYDHAGETGWEVEDEQKLRLFLNSSTGKRMIRRGMSIALKGMDDAAIHGTPHASGVALGRKQMVVWLKSLSANLSRNEAQHSSPLPGADEGAEETVPDEQ